MEKRVFIWRESVYKAQFRCNCGNQLADPDTGEPRANVLVGMEGETMYCPRCGLNVAVFRDVEVDDQRNGLCGHISNLKGDADE